MSARYAVLGSLAALFAVVGYFFFAIVVAIYTGIWLHGEKMYYAEGLSPHVFGAVGAAFGVLLAWGLWRLGVAVLDAVGGRVKPGFAGADPLE